MRNLSTTFEVTLGELRQQRDQARRSMKFHSILSCVLLVGLILTKDAEFGFQVVMGFALVSSIMAGLNSANTGSAVEMAMHQFDLLADLKREIVWEVGEEIRKATDRENAFYQ